MKIFLSWSGERSRLIAEALKVWLPDVISFFEPWISSEDLEKGARWVNDLGLQLQDTDIGIICLTKENVNAPWILFESGALAKALDRGRVCTYLFEMKPRDLVGPLVQFQATLAEESDTYKLLQTLNKLLKGNARSDAQLQRIFRKWWPELQAALEAIPEHKKKSDSRRADRELLEELIDLVRQQAREREPRTTSHLLQSVAGKSLVDNSIVREFAARVTLKGDSSDPNAEMWAGEIEATGNLSKLGGHWSSRWRNRTAAWHTGVATILTYEHYFVLLHIDPKYNYLMICRQDERGRLVGQHYNLFDVEDSSPWVGVVVDDDRIDGQWKYGRWDLRR